MLAARRILLESNPRRAFLASLRAILGDQRAVWAPRLSDGLIGVDDSGFGHKITHSATPQGRLAARGNGAALTFNGSSQYMTLPDAASLSFGNASADVPLSVVALANVTDTAGFRVIVAKYDFGVAQEWLFRVDNTDKLGLFVVDYSAAAATPSMTSDAAITQGSWVLLAGTYDGRGGATAADGMALYSNGAAIAATATNVGTYVAMENMTGSVTVGIQNPTTPAFFFNGSMALVAICAKALTAADHAAIASLCRAYFGLAL